MNNCRIRKTIHRATMNDGLGRVFSIAVPIEVTDFWIDGRWEEAISCEEMQKIERAIEATYPGWFHTCYNTKPRDKANCRACKRAARIASSRPVTTDEEAAV